MKRRVQGAEERRRDASNQPHIQLVVKVLKGEEISDEDLREAFQYLNVHLPSELEKTDD